jgi:hypothetical protein
MPTEAQELNTPEDILALPNFSVVVANSTDVPGIGTAVIVLQKIHDDWYTPGFPQPLDPRELKDVFFPAKVIFQL